MNVELVERNHEKETDKRNVGDDQNDKQKKRKKTQKRKHDSEGPPVENNPVSDWDFKNQ